MICLCGKLLGQQLFPVKINKKWGLINSNGKLVTDPAYDAIGEFSNGLAVMQKNGLVGVFDESPKEIVPARYEDVKVLTKEMISVREKGSWKVVNITGKLILPTGYDEVEVLSEKFLRFRDNKLWGLVDVNGTIVQKPAFRRISTFKDQYFLTENADKKGLLNQRGDQILPPQSEELEIISKDVIFHKKNNNWGAVDASGANLLDNAYQIFDPISPHFIKLVLGDNLLLYSVATKKVITDMPYGAYFPFSKDYASVKKGQLIGLMDTNGNWQLEPEYNEIQPYGKNRFRVRRGKLWGIVDKTGNEILPFEFEYIAPPKHKLCLVRQDGKFGVCNLKGKVVVPTNFSKVEIEKREAKAYLGSVLSIFEFDSNGNLLDKNNLGEHFTITIGKPKKEVAEAVLDEYAPMVLDYFEWFYEPITDKWGLRDIQTGENKIDPVFDYVRVHKDLHLTLVGIKKPGKFTFDQTNYRFEMTFGLVDNIDGNVITEVSYYHIAVREFKGGNPLAHCILENGKHGLMLRSGTLLVKGYTYIGEFSNGMARISAKGKLSGELKERPTNLGRFKDYIDGMLTPSKMLDFTAHDQKFEKEAYLTCEGCEWGYVDTLGKVQITPQYDFAKDFTNDVCIVLKDNKWGAVNFFGRQLIPFEFDEIGFLDKTGNKVIRVYKKESKYGLIDTLGQIQIGAVFDDIGSFSEGKLAVKRNNFWGFVNGMGTEVIPCRFQEVHNYSEGLVSVKMKNQWGFADAQGEVIIKPQFTRAGNFNNGLAWVKDKSGFGYIDTTGQLIFQGDYQKVFDFRFKVARVIKDGKYGLINTSGETILKPKYSEIGEFNKYGLAKVRYGSDKIRYGIINVKGTMVTNRDFKEIRGFKEGFAAVKYKDGFGFINIQGELVIDAEYSKVSDFSEGVVAVQQNGRCGYLNKKGKWFVKPEYSRCLDYNEGIGVVYLGLKKAGLLNKEGKLIVEPKINRLLTFSEGLGLVRDSSYRFYYITEKAKLYDGYYQKAGKFQHGIAVVQMDGKWGIINQKGIEITPPKYDKISQFEEGYAKVRIKGFNGLTDTNGKSIVQPEYEYITYAGEGLFRVEQGDKIGYFNSDGVWVWDLTQ